jgi:hypothetical protein
MHLDDPAFGPSTLPLPSVGTGHTVGDNPPGIMDEQGDEAEFDEEV